MTPQRDLAETYENLRDGLKPLGIDIDREVVDLWVDRQLHGQEALPADALRKLSELFTRLASTLV